jgi:hypothetical protein
MQLIVMPPVAHYAYSKGAIVDFHIGLLQLVGAHTNETMADAKLWHQSQQTQLDNAYKNATAYFTL